MLHNDYWAFPGFKKYICERGKRTAFKHDIWDLMAPVQFTSIFMSLRTQYLIGGYILLNFVPLTCIYSYIYFQKKTTKWIRNCVYFIKHLKQFWIIEESSLLVLSLSSSTPFMKTTSRICSQVARIRSKIFMNYKHICNTSHNIATVSTDLWDRR